MGIGKVGHNLGAYLESSRRTLVESFTMMPGIINHNSPPLVFPKDEAPPG